MLAADEGRRLESERRSHGEPSTRLCASSALDASATLGTAYQLVDNQAGTVGGCSTEAGETGSSRRLPSPGKTSQEESAFGLSSNIGFIRQVVEAVDYDGTSSHPPIHPFSSPANPTSGFVGFATVQPSAFTDALDTISLPERLLADILLQGYWGSLHLVFPVLHQPSFIKSYKGLWEPVIPSFQCMRHKPEDIMFHATLNMVFALGCEHSERVPVEQKRQLANTFYKRSHGLISIETLDFSSLEVVQLLLLRGVYLLYTSHTNRCWNVIGVAVRVAQGLGLHLEQNESPRSMNQLSREMRRRTWYCCVFMDRLSATTFGRPVLHQRPYSIPLPQAIDDEFLSDADEGCQASERVSRMSFFVYSIKLFDIWDDILRDFYLSGDRQLESGQAVAPCQDPSRVHDLCIRLDKFVDDLPNHLKADSCGSDLNDSLADCFRMQAQVLKSRVLYLRLLLLRPSLLAAARQRNSAANSVKDNTAASFLRNSYLKDINLLCVETAHNVLHDLHQKLESGHRTIVWHDLLFAFGAGSVLLAASLCSELGVSLELEPARTSWEKALQIFDYHKTDVESAEKGIQVLKMYHRRIWSATNHGAITRADGDPPTTDLNLDIGSGLDEMWWTSMAQDFSEILGSDSLNGSWLGSYCND